MKDDKTFSEHFLNENKIRQVISLIQKEQKNNSKQKVNKIEEDKQTKNQQYDFDGHIFQQKSNLMQVIELNNCYVLAFPEQKAYSFTVTIFTFQKSNGKHQSLQTKQIEGYITCMKFIIDTLQKEQLYLIFGLKNGIIKILQLGGKISLSALKLDVKKIEYIENIYQNKSKQSYFFALAQDSIFYLINVQKNELVSKFRPNIISCDKALSISVHIENDYLLQTTQGGYIIIWKLHENIFTLGNHKKRDYQIFPKLINHTAASQGLIWAEFYGNLIIIITKIGELKLLSFNLSNQNEWICLWQYKIQKYNTIYDIQLISRQQRILIGKRDKYDVIQQIFLNSSNKRKMQPLTKIKKLRGTQQFYLTNNRQIFVCRNSFEFLIGEYPAKDHYLDIEVL